MNLKNLNDNELLASTARAVRIEKEALISVLRHIKEVDRRRLYSDLKHSSLCQWLMKEHGYSEFESISRISAMRLLEDLPELEEKITNGEMTLTNIGYAQTLFRQERRQGNIFTKSEKLEVLEKLEGKTTREAKSITLSLSSKPENLRPEKITQVSATKLEILLTANLSLENKLRDIKGLRAHEKPTLTLGELFEDLADFYLEQRKQPCALKKSRVTKPATATATAAAASIANGLAPSRAATTRAVFARADYKCEICKSTYALQEDHIRPRALGGGDELDNLRAFCRNCNLRSAIKILGQTKMDRFLT